MTDRPKFIRLGLDSGALTVRLSEIDAFQHGEGTLYIRIASDIISVKDVDGSIVRALETTLREIGELWDE